jgi:DNA-binding response OmpR family regulator
METSDAVVLVVDDEEKILDIVCSYLEREGFSTRRAKSGLDALAAFHRDRPDLVLLDLMLDDMDGEDVCRRIRGESEVPVIMLTAKTDERSIISGLRLGADDYIKKPFSPREMVERVKTILRRGKKLQTEKKQTLRYGDLIVDTENRLVRLKDAVVNLTHTQFSILALLMGRPQKIFTREEIIDAVKGSDFDGFDRSIDTHIKNLRKCLKTEGGSYIQTVYGAGYRFGTLE